MADRTSEIPKTSYIPTSSCDVATTYDNQGEVISTTKKAFTDKNEASACAAYKGKDYYVEVDSRKEFEASEITSSSSGSRGRIISSTYYYVSRNPISTVDRLGGHPEP